MINDSLLQSIHNSLCNQENLTPHYFCSVSPRGILCNNVFFCISLEGNTENCCYLWSMGKCAVFMKTSWRWGIFHVSCPLLKRVNRSVADFHHKGPNSTKHCVFFVASLRTILTRQSNYRWFQTPWCSCDINLTNRCSTQPALTNVP